MSRKYPHTFASTNSHRGKAIKLLTVADVLSRLPISRMTLNKLIDRGECVQPLQLAGQLMFVEDEFEAWLKKYTAKQPRGLYQPPKSLQKHYRRGKGSK